LKGVWYRGPFEHNGSVATFGTNGRLLHSSKRASGARFSDTFQRLLPDGGISSERLLSSEPLWEAAVAFARTEVGLGVPPKDLLALAARSAEFDAANQLLNKGAKLENLVFTPSLLLWPDDGLESDIEIQRNG
jgi:hypothetical protein